MPITVEPMRRLMQTENISYYRLANEGIDAQTLQRIRHDRPITTETLGKLCAISLFACHLCRFSGIVIRIRRLVPEPVGYFFAAGGVLV